MKVPYDLSAEAQKFREQLDRGDPFPDPESVPSRESSQYTDYSRLVDTSKNTSLVSNASLCSPEAAFKWLTDIDRQGKLRAANCERQWLALCRAEPGYVLSDLKKHLALARKRTEVKCNLGLIAAKARRDGKTQFSIFDRKAQ